MAKRKPKSTLLTVRQFAKLIGVTHAAVDKAVHSGRISISKTRKVGAIKWRYVNPKKAKLEWEANGNKSKKFGKTRKQLGRGAQPDYKDGKKEGNRSGHQGYSDGDDGAGTDSHVINLSKQRAVKEAFNARLAQIEYQEKIGKLVPVDKIRIIVFNMAAKTRDALLNVPDRISAIVTAEKNPKKNHETITNEIKAALENLSGGRITIPRN